MNKIAGKPKMILISEEEEHYDNCEKSMGFKFKKLDTAGIKFLIERPEIVLYWQKYLQKIKKRSDKANHHPTSLI